MTDRASLKSEGTEPTTSNLFTRMPRMIRVVNKLLREPTDRPADGSVRAPIAGWFTRSQPVTTAKSPCSLSER